MVKRLGVDWAVVFFRLKGLRGERMSCKICWFVTEKDLLLGIKT